MASMAILYCVPMILAALFCRSCSARSSHGEENWTERSLLAQAPINQLFESQLPTLLPPILN